MSMNTVIVILLVWLIVFLHFVWLDIKPWEWLRGQMKPESQQGKDEPERQPQATGNFIGKSLVKIEAKVTNAASVTPKVPQAEEGEEVDEKDVTFAQPKQEKAIRQMTPEEEEEAFKSFRYSKEEQDDDDEYPAEGYATGLTSEEMEHAVSVANGAKATNEEELKAGKVLKEMDGTELINLLTKKNPAFKSKVRELLDKCERANKEANEETPAATERGRKSFMIEKTTDIDIRDFI